VPLRVSPACPFPALQERQLASAQQHAGPLLGDGLAADEQPAPPGAARRVHVEQLPPGARLEQPAEERPAAVFARKLRSKRPEQAEALKPSAG